MGAVGLLHLAAGAFLALLAWLMPRHVAGTSRAAPWVVFLDIAPFAFGAGILGLASGRPVFAGLVTLALGAGFTLVDYTMRETLREPVVFSAASELPQVFTHPHLYLPFAGPGLVVGGAAAAVAAALALLVVEPPLWTPHPFVALLAVALMAACIWFLAREPLLGAAAAILRRLGPTGEPFADAAALGPFAMLLVHTTIARAERRARQIALAAPPVMRERGSGPIGGAGGPIVVVQCESFFDARRLSPLIPRDLLPGFEACCAEAAAFGRLAVPAWGANTMRAEFAVLTGAPESELGYDRFNPYYALARVPIASQVWRLRRAGYRTICLHPFDRRFFRRDLAMPALGFEKFLDCEALGGSAVPPYCPDPEFAGQILRILEEEGPRTFIFAITMGNHGPWLASGPPIDPAVSGIFDGGPAPDRGELLRYLDGLRRSDAMLRVLMDGLARYGSRAVLAFYGDHLPSLSTAFRHFGFEEWASDYAIWPGRGTPQPRDLPVHELARLIVDSVLGADAAPALDFDLCHAIRQRPDCPP